MSTERLTSATFSEPEAQRILARAAELDGAIGTRFTIDELRQIAVKAGIDTQALEHAIHETDSAVIEPRTIVAPGSSGDALGPLTPQTMVTLGVAGAALGLMAMGADRLGVQDAFVLGPSALYAMYRAIRHPLGGGIAGVLRELAVVFGSFTLAVVAVNGVNAASEATGWSLVCGALASGMFALRAGIRSQSTNVAPVDTR
jgi:hypothetical protein